MEIGFTWKGQGYMVDVSRPIDIAIPLKDGEQNQPNAYDAPLYAASPVRSDNFIGSLDAGAPVNFFNVAINPHGNGTHTECVGHVLRGDFTIRECLQRSLYIAEVVSVYPEEYRRGMVITRKQLESLRLHEAEALIVRTMPNPEQKMFRKYSGTNPAWFEEEAMKWVVQEGYLHLLTDLPSIDPEVDGGALAAHRAFWNVDAGVRKESTITEMIYVPENVEDGLYLLDLHTAALELDVSPSRPMLYVMRSQNEN